MKNISIYDFLKTKKITPQEIKDNFQFIRRIDVDMIHHKGCPNCGDTANFYDFPSPAWTYVNICNTCNTIMITYVTDRMGGGNKDTVDVYKEITDNEPSDKLSHVERTVLSMNEQELKKARDEVLKQTEIIKTKFGNIIKRFM